MSNNTKFLSLCAETGKFGERGGGGVLSKYIVVKDRALTPNRRELKWPHK